MCAIHTASSADLQRRIEDSEERVSRRSPSSLLHDACTRGHGTGLTALHCKRVSSAAKVTFARPVLEPWSVRTGSRENLTISTSPPNAQPHIHQRFTTCAATHHSPYKPYQATYRSLVPVELSHISEGRPRFRRKDYRNHGYAASAEHPCATLCIRRNTRWMSSIRNASTDAVNSSQKEAREDGLGRLLDQPMYDLHFPTVL
jgi:hypothetical protein